MKSFYQKLLTELDNELQLIQIETEEPLKTAELFIKVLLLALDKMRKHMFFFLKKIGTKFIPSWQ